MSHFRECPNCGHQFYIDSKTDACYPCLSCGVMTEIVPSLAEHKKQAAELAALRALMAERESMVFSLADDVHGLGDIIRALTARVESAEARIAAALALLDGISGSPLDEQDYATICKARDALRDLGIGRPATGNGKE